MATCPRCKGHLTDTHRCPKRPALVATEIAVAAIAGGLAGLVLIAAIDPRDVVTTVDTVAIVTGAALGVGLDRFFRS